MSIKSEIRLIEQKLLPVKNNNFNLDSLSDWTGTTAEDAVGSFFTHSKITNSVRSKNNFTTPPTVEEDNGYSIGDEKFGGKIAYILQPGDPGYEEGKIKGLVATINDITGIYKWGCYGVTFTNGFILGSGLDNTIGILSVCSESYIAAEKCYNLVEGGYNDWFLPSLDELSKLYLNRTIIGNFQIANYWSSTISDNIWDTGNPWCIRFTDGLQRNELHANSYINVRPIRYFEVSGGYTEDDRTLKQSLPYDYDIIASEPFPNCKAIRVDYTIFGITNTGDTQYTFYLENLSGTTRTENGDYFDIFYVGTTTTTTTLPPPTTTTTTTLPPTTTTTTTLPPYTGITGDSLIENRIFIKSPNEEIISIKTAFPYFEVPIFNNVPNDWGWAFSKFNLDTRLENELLSVNGWLINYSHLITSDGYFIDPNGNFLATGNTFVDEQSVLISEVLSIVKGSGFDDDIRFVYKQLNDRYIVGGDFLNYNGEQFRYIMRLLPNGDPDYSFNRDGEGFSENVGSFVDGIYNDYNGHIWVTGLFDSPTYNGIVLPTGYNRIFLMDYDGNDILFSYVTNPLPYSVFGVYSTSYDYLERTLNANNSYNLVPRIGDLLAVLSVGSLGSALFLYRNDGTSGYYLQQGGTPVSGSGVSQIEFEKLPIEIGVYTNEFGYIAHIYEPGEEGYIDGFVSGFGVSTEDLNPNLWFDSYVGEVWGCNNFLGATTTNGYYNSNLLYNSGCGLIETLKTVNQDVFLLRDNSTSHFYIPSKEEMLIIHQNLSTILNYYGSYSNYYWTSTEVNAIQVYCFDISDGSFHIISKSNIGRTLNGTPLPTLNVTPIRYFRVKKPLLF